MMDMSVFYPSWTGLLPGRRRQMNGRLVWPGRGLRTRNLEPETAGNFSNCANIRPHKR